MTKAKILFLHHSTGGVVWEGGVKRLIDAHNKKRGDQIQIEERAFPKDKPYGWNNYPYDYWNIWVDHAGTKPYQDEPTLEMLAPQYDMIVFKHCFPVSGIRADDGKADVRSSVKTLANYKLQYDALKRKMRSFPSTRFLVWTPAALVQADTNPEEAARTRTFADWILKTWDEPGDNIWVWDFYALETEGGPYLKAEYAAAPEDSHPNEAFAVKAAERFVGRIVDVLSGRGDTGNPTGEAGRIP